MISSTRNPVYAKQKLSPARPCGWLFPSLVPLVFLVALPCSTRADSLEDTARALARKVASSLQGTTVSCESRNLAALSEARYSVLVGAFRDELQRRGVKVLPQHSTAKIALTLSKRLTDYLGIVQIVRGEDIETIVQSFGRIADANLGISALPLQLHKEFLFDQDQPILDIHSADNFKHVLVLGPGEIASYELRNENWVLTDVTRLPLAKTQERRPRGTVAMGIDEITARVAAEICVFPMLALDRAKWSCKLESEVDSSSLSKPESIWGKKSPAWSSAASLESGDHSIYVIRGEDGISRLYEDGPNSVASFSGWGSEIASVQSLCGTGSQLLISSPADWTSNDTLTAVEFQERMWIRVTNPVEVPGPVISIRGAVDMGKGPTKAVAVVRNLQTGKYEAYVLSIACAN